MLKKIALNRTNQILIGVLVLQLILVVVAFWPQPAPVAAGEVFFHGLEPDQVVYVTIRDGQGEEIEFSKELDTWVLTDTGSYPCIQTKVAELLSALTDLETGRLVTQTPASHKRLKVSSQDYQHRIEFRMADGAIHAVYVGTSPSYGASHVRVEGQNQVYLTSNLSGGVVGTRPSLWIETEYLTVPREQVTSVVLENASGRHEFVQDEEGTWGLRYLAEGEASNPSAVSTLVNRAISLRMVRPLRITEQASYGLDDAGAKITIQTSEEDGTQRTYTLQVFVQVEGTGEEATTNYIAKASTSPYTVMLSGAVAKDWVEKTRDDLLAVEPTPMPEVTPTPEPTS